MTKTRQIICNYQNLIDGPPMSREQMYSQACSNDRVTIDAWRDKWLFNITANKKRFGSFAEHSLGKLWGTFQNQPCIIVGSGPSLKYNVATLLENHTVPVVSCLHNFHLMEDSGIKVDFYVSLDAGELTIGEVSEGGKNTPEGYWNLTKEKTLLCYIGTHPELLEKWQGKVYFFNAPVPDDSFRAEVEKIENFQMQVSNGGNVLGACLYVAKGILGCNPIAFMGSDFSFGYDHKFHAWDSKYDQNLGTCIYLTDVFGNRVLTWQSYANFKTWFDWVCVNVPGLWINCTEGGCLGSYSAGNINQIKYMDLTDFLKMYQMSAYVKEQCLNPDISPKNVPILF